MDKATDLIKEKLPILDVAREYLTLEKAGSQYRALCPFHNEKSPSFTISPDRNSFYCFGCGAKGDIFTLVAHMEGADFRDALQLLAEKAGVDLGQFKRSPETKEEPDRLYLIMNKAMHTARVFLDKSDEAKAYLATRGITEETIERFSIGFVPNEWRALSEALASEFTEDEILLAGITKKNEEGKVYDRFRGRIMFPIRDTRGRVIAFSGRILPSLSNDETPKYLNSPETPLFKKSQALFGLYEGKTAIRDKGFAIMVEGQIDLVMAHQAGYRMAIATSGTAVTDEHLRVLRQRTENLLLSLDADAAGMRAMQKVAMIALPKGFNVKVAVLPPGKDPADVIVNNPDEWKTIVKRATPVITFFTNRLLSQQYDSQKAVRESVKHILPMVAAISQASERSLFMGEVAQAIGVPVSALEADLTKVPEPTRKTMKRTAPDERMRLSALIHIIKARGGEAMVLDHLVLPEAPEEIIFAVEQDVGESTVESLIQDASYLVSRVHYAELIARYDQAIRDLKEVEKNGGDVGAALQACKEASDALSAYEGKR